MRLIILSEMSQDGVPWTGYLVILGLFILAWYWNYTDVFNWLKKKK